ncbi:putative Ferrochelatase [Leishmania naiffi]|uniref:Ferrochelatase n=1 Tax=Leishmania naiffi TaxID=5678 RepID=A0AAW3B7B7_9TRYP
MTLASSDAHLNNILLAKQAKVCFAMSPGFAVDCVETLNKINLEAAKVFKKNGGRRFIYVPCLNDSDAHVKELISVFGT